VGGKTLGKALYTMKGEFYKGERVYGVMIESILDYRNSLYVRIARTSC